MPASVSEAAVLSALRAVKDPDLGRDIVALEFIKDLRVSGSNVAFAIELTTPACPVKDVLKAQAEQVVAALPGVAQVSVTMTSRVTTSKPLLGGKGVIKAVKNVVAVSSGKGGVGKSTVAVNLACALQRTGARVGILDADVYGPNVPLMLGVKGQPEDTVIDGVRYLVPVSAHGLEVMSIGVLIPEDQPVIWRGPRLHSAIKTFLFEVHWGDLDYLVVDLPPGTGDAQLSLTQQAHVTGAVVVTTPQDVAVLDVRRAIRMFQDVQVPILGVVENMAYFTPPGSSERFEIFGRGGGSKIEMEFGVPLLGQIPIDLAVRDGGDHGRPIVAAHPNSDAARALCEIAGRLAARISTANAT
jgi:ATP-binding protein involved in chromosome partitioning